MKSSFNNFNKNKKIELLFCDQYLAVINKPYGLLSVPYPGSSSLTAQGVLEEILRKRGNANSKHKPFAVHRLDRDTSGVMCFALSQKAQKIIMDTWQKMIISRIYRALAENPQNKNLLLPPKGIIDAPIALNAYHIGFVPKQNTRSNTASPTTVTARTHFTIIEKGRERTLFELLLDTGRKNQIRAHLAYKGYPIVGDKEHGAKTNPFNRVCLHARTLTFVHPWTKKTLSFEIPEPKEWWQDKEN